MKRVCCLALLACGLLAVSLNATARCTCYLPNAPEIPDGATAESAQMKYAKNQLASYQRKMNSYRQCLQTCIVEADDRENRAVKAWNATVEAFNANNEGRLSSR